MSELALRDPTEADAGAISEICNAVSLELYGTADADEAEIRSWFTLPGLKVFLAERGGRVVGYGDVRNDDDGTRFPIDLRIPPEARGSGVADVLREAAERWARGEAKPGALLRGYAAERDAEVVGSYLRAGYRVVRHSFHMQIELEGDLPEPEWPEGVAVRRADLPRDERAIYECAQEAFRDSWDFSPTPIELWRKFMAMDHDNFDPELWWLAEADSELAGVCLNLWHISGDRTFGWIEILAVREPWRRRGLGLALLRHSFRDFAARGATRVGLGVDAENSTGAVRLYERAGMRPVRRNDTFEKPVS